jgi:hypothetical protein
MQGSAASDTRVLFLNSVTLFSTLEVGFLHR